MKRTLCFGALLAGLVVHAAPVEPPACSRGGTNVWGDNVRTGKSVDQPSEALALEQAYAGFVSHLAPLGKDCFRDRGGYLEFGPVQSFTSGPVGASGGHWASFVAPIACCVR